MEKIIIIGGGVAGLSCLNALLDKGVNALLLEGAEIGTPKMCGEFLAPPALPYLKKWNIGPIQTIKQIQFHVNNRHFKLTLPNPAGAFSRSAVECQLADRARQLGGRIQTNTFIQSIEPATLNAPYHFTLSSGEKIQAETAIFATGKLAITKQSSPPPFPYYGMKIHFSHIAAMETLLMYSFPGIYLGVVPISQDKSNCTALIKSKLVEKAGSCKQLFSQLIEQTVLKSTFESINLDQMDWFESVAPEFQLRSIPNWPNSFWIGDALGSVYPAIGYGFAHSVNSALIAVESYLANTSSHYLPNALAALKPKIRLGKWMHHLLFRPTLGNLALPFLKTYPWLTEWLLQKINY